MFTLIPPPVFSPSAYNYETRKYLDVTRYMAFTMTGAGTIWPDNEKIYFISDLYHYDPVADE